MNKSIKSIPHSLLNLEDYKKKINKTKITNKRALDQYLRLREKGLCKYFDDDYYIAANPDIANIDIHPLAHYFYYGEMEFRRPNAYFDPKYYSDQNPDVSKSSLSLLEHYVLHGWRENRQPYEDFDPEIFATTEALHKDACPLDYLMENKPPRTLYSHIRLHPSHVTKKGAYPIGRTPRQAIDRTTDILIPIYNGLHHLQNLIRSIFENTETPFRLILVNDGSTDNRIKPFLQDLEAAYPNIILLEHSTNQGFPTAVNTGFREVKSSIFILLNTDTLVPDKWLSRLIAPLEIDKNVASATPFSNNATICSFPNQPIENDVPTWATIDQIDFAFSETITRSPISLPTGVGFCMAIRKSVVDEIGFFDATAFNRGYGEENDWCLRAYQAGYRNVIAQNLFVFHAGTASFTSEEKEAAGKSAIQTIQDRYPYYNQWVQDFIKDDPLRLNRFAAIFNLMRQQRSDKVLLLDLSAGGGSNLYSDRIISKLRNEGVSVLKLAGSFMRSTGYGVLHHKEISIPVRCDFEDIKLLIEQGNFSKIIVNSLVFNIHYKSIINTLIDLKSNIGYKMEFMLHDHYAICPSYTLLSKEDKFCNIPSLSECRSCIPVNPNNAKKLNISDLCIDSWRTTWGSFLLHCDKIVAFSEATKRLFEKAYPILIDSIQVIPHTVHPPARKYHKPIPKTNPRIAFVGAIDRHKGAEIVLEIDKINRDDNLGMQLTVIGILVDPHNKFSGKVTGRYNKDSLGPLLTEHEIDVVFFPSICPETFSFLTQELIELECDLGAFPIGAPGERVGNYKNGFLARDISAAAAIEAILKHWSSRMNERNQSEAVPNG